MLDRSVVHLLWIFEYLWPVVLATVYLLAVALPQDQGFLQVALLIAGAYIGNALLVLDSKWLYPKYNELQTVPQRLITRSVIFIVAFIVAAFFVVSSSGNSMGIGLVLGLGFSLWAEMVAYLATKPDFFSARYLFQLKRSTTHLEHQFYVIGVLAVLLGLSIMGLF